MPIYEYVCTACGERFEIKQKLSDPPITTCADFSCSKGEPVTKVISPPAIMFKGSGWYVTDYSDKFKEPKKVDSDGKTGEKSEKTKAGSTSDGSTKSGEGSSGTTSAETSSSSSSSSSTSSPSSTT